MDLYYTIYPMGSSNAVVNKSITGKAQSFGGDTTSYTFPESNETLVNGIYEVVIQNRLEGVADGWFRAIVESNNNGTTTIQDTLSADRDI